MRRPQKKHEGLMAEVHAEAKPGCCSMCDGILPPPLKVGRKRKICHLPECQRAYVRTWKAFAKERQAVAK